jgi:hypothetical protein
VGGNESDALFAQLTALEGEGPSYGVVDPRRITRSNSILDVDAVGPDEAIILHLIMGRWLLGRRPPRRIFNGCGRGGSLTIFAWMAQRASALRCRLEM